MSKLNINKSEWLELVFEGKNKEYGAYKLRSEEGTTTVKAFISALVFLTALALLPVLFSSFTDNPLPKEPEVILDDELIVTEVVFHEEKIIPLVTPKGPASQAPITTETLTNPVVVAAENAPETEFTKPEDVGKPTTVETNGTQGTGTPTFGGNGNSDNPEPAKIPELMTSGSVDKSPLFPGGIDAFLQMVGNRFRAPEADEEGTAKRVIVFFVVEKDGSLSNITVPKSPGYGLDVEAIRVLKSIKTKWEPGMYKGQPVRTQYSLPIVVKMQ